MDRHRSLDMYRDDEENMNFHLEQAQGWGKLAIKKVQNLDVEGAYFYSVYAAQHARQYIMHKALVD